MKYENLPELLTATDIGRTINKHRNTVIRWMNKGYINTVRIANKRYVRKNDFIKWWEGGC